MADRARSDLDRILGLRKGEHGGVNFGPANVARGWNQALVAVADALSLAPREEVEAELRRRLREDDDAMTRRIAQINDELANER